MDIKTRKQAMIDGENTYFTGRPCKHGHMTYRYVQSGSCYDCVNGNRVKEDSPTAIARSVRLREVAARFSDKTKVENELVIAKFRIFDVDFLAFLDAAWAFAVMRYPSITHSDIRSKMPPTDNTSRTSLYTLKCHIGDVEALRIIETGMYKAHAFDIGHDQRLQKALADIEIEPVPAWADRP